ncbi:hypothetical protein GUITHDRAFT_113596 [Guillardia theta CCMP2712]|uniref:Uncharacterized protein n=1 Tax=Guillardia theta (strain CCMP2712) TaxID=905079 RepID=L1IWW9_GUITC|nr:hypothetical protein GUITHDRAFT_113596 [Guillardia theta CCMP2712]EKX40359.1 hypothetical protein GUITHDRAFT_113596 [Guillardia theta CCMP2712]|eukprot:XP_005827339.1 hypothetical protein GUITHDRAFT_113596 [Guillardia theta CCMP2712]
MMSALKTQDIFSAAELAMLAERKLREEKKSRLCRCTSLQCIQTDSLVEGGSPHKKPLDAEDFRFHAVREVAYRQWQDKVPPKHGGMKKVFSELGSLSKALQETLEEEARGGKGEQLSTILEDVFTNDEGLVAKPYLAWACNKLGVQHMYAAFEKRVDKARQEAEADSEEEEEEELGLEDMIRDSFGLDSVSSEAMGPKPDGIVA